jgi:hypothetical protein
MKKLLENNRFCTAAYVNLKYSLFICIVLLLVTCKPKDRDLFVFSPALIQENEITLSQLADGITYIPLDDSILLAGINSNSNPLFVNNHMYLYDRNQGILIFNRDGRFLRKVGKIGRGPGEYLHGGVFAVDNITGSVYLNDLNSLIKVYSGNGDYQRSFSLIEYGGSIDALTMFNERLFVTFNLQFGDDFKYEWVFLDTLGNIVNKKERAIPLYKSNYLTGGGTYFFDQKMKFWHNFKDTVYSFNPDLTYRPNFILTPGDYRLPKSYVDDPIRRLPEYIMFQQIFETKKYLIIRYSFYKGKNGLIIIDKKDYKSYTSYWTFDSFGSITNDLDGGLKFLPLSFYIEDGREYLAGLVDPFQLKARANSNEFKSSTLKNTEKKKVFEKMAYSLKETDNPVLMIIRLKK